MLLLRQTEVLAVFLYPESATETLPGPGFEPFNSRDLRKEQNDVMGRSLQPVAAGIRARAEQRRDSAKNAGNRTRIVGIMPQSIPSPNPGTKLSS